MFTATQSSAALMRHKKSELVDEVMALRRQLGALEAAKHGPSVTGASDEIAVALIDAVEHLRGRPGGAAGRRSVGGACPSVVP